LYSSAAFWISAIACLLAGLAAGWLMRRQFDPAEQRLRDLERSLHQSEVALQDYQAQVTAHFRGTAERVNRLTENYRELHQHLAEGALELCDTRQPGVEPPLLTSLGGPGYRPPGAGAPTSVSPPRDYAPRSSPEEPGILSERYDLQHSHGG
jgi:uncharacterized protein